MSGVENGRRVGVRKSGDWSDGNGNEDYEDANAIDRIS